MAEIEVGIPGVVVVALKEHQDGRGRLMELVRDDELPPGMRPAMAYISWTKPGVTRGPHEHADQTDAFVFLDGSYELFLWENRRGRPDARTKIAGGVANPCLVIVPPGVVHAYRNVGEVDAFVLNFPDRLYAGWGRLQVVDEIRHEDDPLSRFTLW